MINNTVINSGLPQLPEGVPQEAYNHFVLIYNAIHKLESLVSKYAGTDTLDPDIWDQVAVDDTVYSGNLNRFYLPAYEALAYGQVVSIINDAGTPKFRKANATNNTKPAFGFVTSPATAAIGERVEVIGGMGLISGVAGMTPGARYFLSTSDGLVTNAAPVAAGNIEQVIGVAITSTRLFMNLTYAWIQH